MASHGNYFDIRMAGRFAIKTKTRLGFLDIYYQQYIVGIVGLACSCLCLDCDADWIAIFEYSRGF